MQLFYTPDITSDTYTLNEQESRHCVKVLRKQTGDILHLTDGKGTVFTAEIRGAHLKACELKVLESKKDYNKRSYYLHIAIAPTKNIDRFEWFLEKCTEIGVDEITPLLCEHSERKMIKPDRLERIVVSAMKQSIKAYKPKINPLTRYSDFINSDLNIRNRFIAHCYDMSRENLKTCYSKNEDACILIGPEGDFSEVEVATAESKGYNAISLGSTRLRTETAGVVACHSVSFINQ